MTWRTLAGRAALAAAAFAVLAPGPTPQGSAGREPHRLLAQVGGFSTADLAQLDAGQPIARALDTERREVAIVGAVRIKAQRDRLLARYRNISSLEGSRMVLQLGRIGAKPLPEDFQRLEFEQYDLDTIRECEPGDCGVRLSTAQLAAFSRDVNWEAQDWATQAASLWRRLLADYATSYLSTGALADYRNKAEPLNVADEFAVLFERSRWLSSVSPEMFDYLRNFPKGALPGVETILYWSKEDVGVRPVTSITHLALYAPGSAARPLVIASRQIYATHYFDAGLGLTLAFDDGSGGLYMMTVHRARTRSLSSFTRTLVRGVVLRRSREGIEHMLRSTQRALENRP